MRKLKVVDLFSGCGGLSLGFEMAGFDIIGGIDFDKDSIITFQKNFKNSITFTEDIRKIPDSIIKKTYKDVDVLVGGPPCQGFSSANMHQKDIKDDKRNLLFLEFLRFVKILRPKVILIENVSGILTKNDSFAKNGIESQLTDLGYEVSQKVLFASNYGVPQKRKRNFFIGIKKSYKKSFDFNLLPQNKKKVTVEEAISDLYALEKGINNKLPVLSDYQKLMRKNSNNKILNHEIRYPNDEVIKRIRYVKEGGNWQDVPENLWKTKRNNRHSSAYRRLNSKDVSITIDTGHMNYFHPKFDRTPTVRESARIQSFPDNFEFTGKTGSQLKQVGNAVPPILAKEIALIIKKYLEEK
ncbi:TPA: DNA (cytosine-5-)-methyltransferase [Candidatus Nomurabacteria bacterium]|nr:MAG: Cytosine-specific methyltransferase [Parcubacteria bacterium RAAC4_OD1_1]HCY26183.1 DNA (cytosine-5-)-methyltransferase [Candidatus Nomurabacteria bacterium]